MGWNFKRFKWTEATLEVVAQGKLDGLSHAKIAKKISLDFNLICTGAMVQACWLRMVDKNYFDNRPEFDDLILATLERSKEGKTILNEVCPVRASILHLLDLKRAGHSPRHTELKIDSEYWPRVFNKNGFNNSYSGSPAAMCVGDL